MQLRIVLTLLVFVTIAAPQLNSAAHRPAPQDAVFDRLHRVDEFAWDGLLFMKDRRTLQQVRNLSKLLGEKVERTPNPHIEGQTIEFRTLVFEGLELHGHITPAQEFSPTTAIITASAWKIRSGLDVGSRATRIKSVLGPP